MPNPPKKNSNSQRGETPATSRIFLRVTPQEKATVVRAAAGEKLSAYIRRRLGLPD